MPNWCLNRIDISADNVSEILAFVKGGRGAFDFESIVPMPQLLRHVSHTPKEFDIDGETKTFDVHFVPISKEGNYIPEKARPLTKEEGRELERLPQKSDYDWRCMNWGCKWNCDHCELDASDNHARFEFYTPWGPPEPVIEALREKFPNADITAFYDEPGMCAAGYY